MRFCLAYPDYPTSTRGAGVGTYVRTLARELVKYGHEVTIVAIVTDRNGKSIDTDNIKIITSIPTDFHWYISKLPVLKRFAEAIREVEYSYALWKVVRKLHREKPFDIVQGTETGSLFLALRQKAMSYSFVLRLHGEKYTIYRHRPDIRMTLDIRLSRIVQRRAIRSAAHLLAATNQHAQNIWNELEGRCQPITVIPNMLDCNEIDDLVASVAPDLTYDADQPIVLYSGRLERGKGLWPLLEAAPTIVKIVPNTRFLIAGNYHPTLSPAEIQRFISSHELENNITIMGHVKWADLFQLYKRAAIFAMPSYYETFGNTFVEAMMVGTPVVGFSGSSLEEIVENGVSGFIVPRGDIDALAHTIITVLTTPKLREMTGQNARKRAVDAFSTTAVMPELNAYYSRIHSEK